MSTSPRTLLVTGCAGLIGSEVCTHFAALGWRIVGLDNNQREVFFGPDGDTSWNLSRLRKAIPGFIHCELDVRDRSAMLDLLSSVRPDAIVHAAAQPSHDLAAKIPFDDFDVNAGGTLNLLEATRRYCIDAPFVFLSTNKVYGDAPNRIQLRESDTRWEYADDTYANGIPETFTIDNSTHSLFGASKLSADILVQEYGRYFGLKTCCLRGGCLTGPNHSGVELHGFLSYLVKTNVEKRAYKIYGYKGKQVRDNIHSQDVATFIEEFVRAPRSGEVYNLGGGRENTCSLVEAFAMVSSLTGQEMQTEYVEEARIGDHVCYYSDLSKCHAHYPNWKIQHSLSDIFTQLVLSWSGTRGILSTLSRINASLDRILPPVNGD